MRSRRHSTVPLATVFLLTSSSLCLPLGDVFSRSSNLNSYKSAAATTAGNQVRSRDAFAIESKFRLSAAAVAIVGCSGDPSSRSSNGPEVDASVGTEAAGQGVAVFPTATRDGRLVHGASARA